MTRTANFLLVAGLIILVWLRFHDLLKPEAPTLADWLTLVLSLVAMYAVAEPLVRMQRRTAH